AALGWWRPEGALASSREASIKDRLLRLREPFFVVDMDGRPSAVSGGSALLGGAAQEPGSLSLLAYVPACPPEALGDLSFCRDHGLRYPYLCGAMANGIASVEVVEAAARAGALGFFGAAGLSLERVEAAIDR
ncbi:MAG: 2-nitropropane dioxygenase, partial [Elusimicrobiota bacterium]